MTEHTPAHDHLALTAQQAAIGMLTACVEGPDSTTFPGSTFEQVHHSMLYGYLEEAGVPLMIAFEALAAALAGYGAGALVHSEGSKDNAIRLLRGKALELEINGFAPPRHADPDEPPC